MGWKTKARWEDWPAAAHSMKAARTLWGVWVGGSSRMSSGEAWCLDGLLLYCMHGFTGATPT